MIHSYGQVGFLTLNSGVREIYSPHRRQSCTISGLFAWVSAPVKLKTWSSTAELMSSEVRMAPKREKTYSWFFFFFPNSPMRLRHYSSRMRLKSVSLTWCLLHGSKYQLWERTIAPSAHPITFKRTLGLPL